MKVIWALVCALLLTGAPSAAHADEVPSPTSTPVSETYVDAASDGFFWQLFLPQDVLPGSFLYALPQHREHRSEGTRSDQEFFEISSTGSNDVPDAALRAYKHAASVMATTDPGCHISWTFLAAIGRVESNHGRFGGSVLGSDGVSRPAIVGPRLDGAGAFAAISDSDGGTLDGDKQWDRAIGQMQFLPGTWRSVARDGDGDGVTNPGDLDDSALAAAVYLCGAGNLSTDAGMAQASFRYNHSDYYVALVLSFAHGYQTGVFVQPSPPPPPGQDNQAAQVTQVGDTKPKKPSTSTTLAKPTTPTTPSGSSTPKPSAPTPSTPGGGGGSSTPPADPAPSPTPEVGSFTGVLRADGDGFTLDGDALVFPGGMLGDPAPDLDGDLNPDGPETLRQELTGLLTETVKLHGSRLAGTITVDEVVGRP